MRVRVRVPDQLRGPLPAGAVVGSAAVLEGRRALATVPVVLERRLPAVSRLTVAARFVTQTWMLVAIIAVAALLVAAVVARAARHPRPPSGGQRGRSSSWEAA